MKYIKEFRNSEIVEIIKQKIESYNISKKIHIMEICGTHTMSIYRYGIKNMLPNFIKLISGPGCPVCVSDVEYIDKAIFLSNKRDFIITTFGDLMKVPGSYTNLIREKAKGNDIRIVYSPLDSLQIAVDNPKKNIVFLGVGFETTTPLIGATILEAKKKNIKNFTILTAHKTIPEAMETLLKMDNVKINGFIAPANVSAVIGTKPYEFIPNKYNVSVVVTGFEPVDIMQGILKIIMQNHNGKFLVENQYFRVVKKEGNKKMQEIMKEVFNKTDTMWRGIGIIKNSGLKINNNYCTFDAEKQFEINIKESKINNNCICGEILIGKKHPSECLLFNSICNPEDPQGACMVSSEGSCSAYFKYGNY